MEHSRFDRLVRALADVSSRRGLLRLLAVVPALGLAATLDEDEAEAGRRRRRKARHRRRQNNRQNHGKRKDKKQNCKSESVGKTCAGTCGTVKNNCKKEIDCGPCCEPACAVCQTCDDVSRTCTPDPEQIGSACGELNEVCRIEGTCASCDVCASGCTYSSVQDAINAASDGEVIHICAGEFNGNITIDRSVILIGAGSGAGAGNTTLVGNENGSVVTVDADITVTLQTLRIDSGDSVIGGGINTQGFLSLDGCTVTGCSADQGGGIFNMGSLILNQSSIEGNFALNNEGGGIYNGNGGHLDMNRSQLTNNKAGRAGGGLFNDSATASLNFSTISGNTAEQNGEPGVGGGIYNEIGTITLNAGSSVTGNNPDNCAGEAVAGCTG